MNKPQVKTATPSKAIGRREWAIIGAKISLNQVSQEEVESLVASAIRFTDELRPQVKRAAKAVLRLADLPSVPSPKRCPNPDCPNELPHIDARAWRIWEGYERLLGLVESVPKLVLVKR